MDGYYDRPAGAYIRDQRPALADLSGDELLEAGRTAGLKLQRFKQTATLPRVRAVLGMLHGIQPANLLDIGSGRGVFLWPLLEEFDRLPVTAVDRDTRHIDVIAAVVRGGFATLSATRMEATSLAFADSSFDAVTVLEVLEHLPRPQDAVREALRVAGRFVIASVPSKADDNPGHIHLFDRESLTRLFEDCGAKRVKIDFVRNYMVCIAAA